MSDRPTFMQRALRTGSKIMLALLTRTRVTGLENVPEKGPLLVLGNHASTIDSTLIMAALPPGLQFVGPGDFKLLFPANLIMKWYGIVPVKRSVQIERAGLKAMTDILKAGHMLGMFPEGGTWEKPITDAKPGAAYVSMNTNTPILPVGLGGTYRVWYKVGRLQRPRITVNFGKVMPPIGAEVERSKRAEAIQAGAQEIMRRIYDLLPAEDRAFYDDLARRKYSLSVQVWRGAGSETVEVPGGAVIGEIMLKPNLLSPLIRNARLPLDPLRQGGRRFPPAALKLAADSLTRTLGAGGSLAGYMEYRLGDARTRDLMSALAALSALGEDPAMTGIALLASSRVE